MAKNGREYVRIALQETLAKAWAHWRPTPQQCLHFGGTESDLYEDYRQAVTNYQVRHARTNMLMEGNT